MRKKIKNDFLYKLNPKNINWGKVLPGGIVVIGFLIFSIYQQRGINEKISIRNKYPHYTIGVIVDFNDHRRGSNTVDYIYYVSGIKHSGREYINTSIRNINTNRGRYFIKYYSKEPSNAEMLIKCPVPDNLENAPFDGWAQLPIECNE